MADEPGLTRIFVTIDPLRFGSIPEVMAEISGERALFGAPPCCITPEGQAWHRTKQAAESYARQLQMARLDELRAEIARLEGLRFGRAGR